MINKYISILDKPDDESILFLGKALSGAFARWPSKTDSISCRSSYDFIKLGREKSEKKKVWAADRPPLEIESERMTVRQGPTES